MAAVLLMLGSVMSAAIAGNRSVKKEVEVEVVEEVPQERVSNSAFWSKEVERVKTEPAKEPAKEPTKEPVPVPLDCEGEWSDWSRCTKDCDGGTQTRNFTIRQTPKNGGEACPKEVETRPCNTEPCQPLDCEGKWSDWSKCTKDCDGGTQFRNFTILRPPENGGEACPKEVETRPCNTESCPEIPITLNGYKNVHTDQGDSGVGKQCGGSPIYSSAKWELVNSDEEKVEATSFDDPYYHKYQRRAAFKCNEDPFCGNITVTKDGKYETFHPSQCINTIANSDVVTWKKVDNTVAARDVPKTGSFNSQEINGYTAIHREVDEPPQKFSWRVKGKDERDILCDWKQKVKYGNNITAQGPEVEFDSPEYQKYVENAISKCEMEHDCNFVSVKKNGYTKMFKACSDLSKYSFKGYKTFKRGDNLPFRPEPPEEIGAGLSFTEQHKASFMGYKPVSHYHKCNNHSQALTNEFIREEGEDKLEWDDFFSHKYQTLLKRGIEICNKDPRCQYLELDHANAIVRTFKKADCEHPQAVHNTGKHKIWEKTDWKDPNIQEPIHGYQQYGSKNVSCGTTNPQAGWITQGVVEGRTQPAESFTKFDKTIDDTYNDYLKKGAMVCNGDPNCKYVSVWLDGTYRTFDASACEDKPTVGYADVKTWKKKDPNVVGSTPTPPPPPPPPPPPVKHGYKNVHTSKMCPENKQKWVKFSGTTVGFESTEYDDNLKSGIMKCNDDPKCKYVTLFRDGLTGLVSEGECDSPSPVQNAKIWEKNDPNVIGFSPPPPPPPPPPLPPPFNCGGNRNAQIPFSSLNDGKCDCLPGFDDEGVDDNGVAKGACKPQQLGSLLNKASLFSSYYYPQQIDEEVPATTRYPEVAKNWSGGYTYEDGIFTAKTQKDTIKQQLPYLIKEDKSGWSNQVFTGKTKSQCEQISKDHPRSPGFTYFVKGRNGRGNSSLCVVYGGNNGNPTDKKCVTGHAEHPDCWERKPTQLEKDYENGVRMYNPSKAGQQGTFWNWGGFRAGEWEKDKYWT